ncbi:MAG: hypothetical protein ACI9S8_000093, partial [Chlamydiales bacterium]
QFVSFGGFKADFSDKIASSMFIKNRLSSGWGPN